MAGPDLAFGRFYGDVWRLIRSAGGAVWAIALGAAALGVAADTSVFGVVSLDDLALLRALASNVIHIILNGLTTAAVILILYASHDGVAVSAREALTAALAQSAPIIVLKLLTFLAILAGFVLLVLPGLYLVAMWRVMLPALMVERAGYSAAKRSAELTRTLRWRVLLLILVVEVILTLPLFFVGEYSAMASAGRIAIDVASKMALVVFEGALSVTLYRRLTVDRA